MAADEQQAKDIVAVVGPVEPLGHRSLDVVEVGELVLVRQGGVAGGLADLVDGDVAADEDQPSGRIARRPLLGPGLQGPEASLLIGLLGGVQVAEVAQQRPHRLGPRRGERRVDPGQIGHPASPAASSRSETSAPFRNRRSGLSS